MCLLAGEKNGLLSLGNRIEQEMTSCPVMEKRDASWKCTRKSRILIKHENQKAKEQLLYRSFGIIHFFFFFNNMLRREVFRHGLILDGANGFLRGLSPAFL